MKQKIVVDSKINFLSFYSGLHNEFEFILDETLQTNADLYIINIWDSDLLVKIGNIESRILLVDNEGEDWNVSQDFIDGNKGWCISPDIVKNNPIFPLLVHSYLEQEAQRQQTESAKKIANKVVYDICTNMRQGRSIR